jgi:hypothetical protein
MARLSPAELYEDITTNASPKYKPWHRVTYVDLEDIYALLDYYPAVVAEVNALDNAKESVDNELHYLVEVTPLPKRAHKNKLSKLPRKYTRLTKKLEDIEYTLEWRRSHTGRYIHYIDPNKGPPGVFFVTKHGRKDNDLTEADRLFLDLHRVTERST